MVVYAGPPRPRVMETARIHPLTLRFTSDRREAAFRADYFRSSLWLMRGALLLGAVQYALFGWLDVAMVPHAAPALHAIRAVVCVFVAGVLALTFTRRFTIRNFQWWLASVPLVAGLGVAAFVAVGQDVSGYYDYYAGQMLILFYVHALLRLRFVWASAVSAVLIGLYVVASATLADTTGILLVNNTFFLLAANFSGMAASYGLEYFARRVFVKAEELRESERRLQREDARKSRELEAARQLQLASLPAALPDHPTAEWSASMRPAAEVGGDYYDWDVAPDGTVTLAIGDATGHGVQAGALVTAMQSVFACLNREDELAHFLRRANRPLRRVGAGRLFMALALARLRGRTLELAGAGMPPALLYRAATGAVETLSLRGLPLGSRTRYPYTSLRVDLHPGDTVVFMTDGLPELFDADRAMVGYEEALALAGAAVGGPPAEVVERLNRAASDWVGGCPQGDDITFLVLRMKPEASAGNGQMHPGSEARPTVALS
jgi:serine phosphatase RsbU (regulator of sigma subunit)